jgi:hypothetical protein
MKTKTVEVVLEEPQNRGYPNCYAAIPTNGKVCPHTGLKHTQMYSLLSIGGQARPYVRVANLRQKGAHKGKTLFHVGDFLRFLDRTAKQQGSATLQDELDV